MVMEKIVLGLREGLHLRPASVICETALNYRCKSEMIIGERTYNLKSVLSVLSAQVTSMREVTLRCEGIDEMEAAKALMLLLEGDSQEENDNI